MTTLKNLEDLDSISLDLDILTSDVLFPAQFTDIKVTREREREREIQSLRQRQR